MTRIIPALMMIYIGTLAAIPWAPRLYGWYADDVGVRVPALAPMSSAPRLVKNSQTNPPANKPIAQSDINRAHGYVVAMMAAFVPYSLVIAVSPSYAKRWVLVKQALRALA